MLRDRYALGPVLGTGRGSTTQLATIAGSGERCVIKSLSVGAVVRDASGDLSFDPDDFTKVIELFEREAKVLANLDHPGIPRFIDHFTEDVDGDTRLHTVQEFVEGKTLKAHVDEGRHFTEDEARDVCRQVAEILAYLHDRSPPLIHRDVKPTNVILDDDGTVHLVDFGSVRNAIGGDDLDGKTIVGTYGYMPVEQYEARAVPQSDLYALGMTLIYMLSHREPTEIPRTGMTLEFGEYVNVSSDFGSILRRMIKPAPEDRYPSAAKLLERLSGPAPQAIFQSVADPLPTRYNRNAARWALVGVGILALLAALLSRLPMMMGGGMPMSGEARGSAGGSGSAPLVSTTGTAVTPVDGVLTLDIHRQFSYVPQGFPMGRAAGQTTLPTLTPNVPAGLGLPADLYDTGTGERADVRFSYFTLGNGPDPRIDFALVQGGGRVSLLVDEDNDNDLADESPHHNEGSGPLMATLVAVDTRIVVEDDFFQRIPYNLWVWFDETADGSIRARFYARNHYRGSVEVRGQRYDVTAFEDRGHDALFRDAGVCIDLSRNGECEEESELFHDGDMVPFPGAPVRLELNYP